MSKYAEWIMSILIILMAAVVFLLLSGEMECVSLTETQTVNVNRAVLAPVLALAAGILAYICRNYLSK